MMHDDIGAVHRDPVPDSFNLPVPPSLAFYWGERANRAAVDILCAGGLQRAASADLVVEELEAFELARLAALRVRHDLWRFLRDVWRLTWAPAMAAHLLHARPLTVGEHDLGGHGSYAPTLECAWNERVTYTLYDLPGQLVAFTSVRLEQDDRRMAFVFSLMDRATGDYPANFTVPTGWHDDGQGWVTADLHLDMHAPEGDDRRAADIGTRFDGTSDDATGSLDLRPVMDAAVALMAHVSGLLAQSR